MEQLRTWRLRRGLSQAALATAAGVKESTVMRLELGRAQPRPATVGRLAAALGIRPGTLLATPRQTRGPAPAPDPAGCALGCGQPLAGPVWHYRLPGEAPETPPRAIHDGCLSGELAPCCEPGGPCGH